MNDPALWCAADELSPYTGDASYRQRRAAELVSLTSLKSGEKKKRHGGIRINAPMVKRALLEAEEAALMHFHAPWSDSEDDEDGADADRYADGDGTDDDDGVDDGSADADADADGGARPGGYVSEDDDRPLADSFGIRAGASGAGTAAAAAAAATTAAGGVNKIGGAGAGAGAGAAAAVGRPKTSEGVQIGGGGVRKPKPGAEKGVVDETIKDGLTPDWVIDAGCRIFDLNTPTIFDPIIRGLLDPCTNNKRNPNIPAGIRRRPPSHSKTGYSLDWFTRQVQLS